MKNIQNLTIDINKKPFQKITANVGEVASRFIRITILENNIPADLTGVTAYLYAKKSALLPHLPGLKLQVLPNDVILTDMLNLQ